MKKFKLFVSVLLAFFPVFLYAQQIQLPSVEIKALQDKVPFKVKEAVLNEYGADHKPFAWVSPQTIYNSLNWEQSTNVNNLEVESYGIHTQSSNGDALDAFYTPDGKKISSRELHKNFRPSLPILMTLQNSEYKDWNIKKDSHLIRTLSNGTEKERFQLVMQKDGKKKYLYFDKDGVLINQKNFALAEAEW